MIVVRGDAAVGFVVDRVERLLAVAAQQMEQDDAGAGTTDRALLDGTIKGSEGQSTIKLLSPSRLLSGQFARLGVSTTRVSRAPVAISISAAAPAQASVSLLSVCLGEQEYALPLDRVREIIPLPDDVSALPRSETAVLGVITLRNRLLPLVALRALLGMTVGGGIEQRGKVVVVSLGEGTVGVVVDATREILRVDRNIIDPARPCSPAAKVTLRSPQSVHSKWAAPGRDAVAGPAIPIGTGSSILADQVSGRNGIAIGIRRHGGEQFIIFQLGDQDYGIPIAAVNEVARRPDHFTRLPKAPAFVDGVIILAAAWCRSSICAGGLI